jgi:dihydroorotase
MSGLLIRGGRVVDPAAGRDEVADVLLAEGRVAKVGEKLSPGAGVETLDAGGLWVLPGLIDVHVHLREPGATEKETIATGASSAAAGGFAAIVAMPNTTPPVDGAAQAYYVRKRGEDAGAAEVLVAGSLTAGRKGGRPSDMAGLARAGVVAFTDDGDEVRDARVLGACMREAAVLGLPVLVHAEDPDLAAGGVVNEGALSSALGLAGRPALAEEVALARDIALARDAGCRLHVQHVSTARGLELVRDAKAEGLPVTCEVTPHHLLLTEEACREYDPNTKVYPPLRPESDRAAVATALVDAVDVVATDHAPHAPEDKGLEFDLAAPGVVGLETALGLVFTEFVHTGKIPPARMVELLSLGPARLLGIGGLGTLAPGSRAHVTVIDPDDEWTVDPSGFLSKSRNTPFAGRKLRGRAAATVVSGRVAFRR